MNDGSIVNQTAVNQAYNTKLAQNYNTMSTFDGQVYIPAQPRPSQPALGDQRFKQRQCLNCTQIGHIAKYCPNAPAPKDMRDRLCHLLGLPVIPVHPALPVKQRSSKSKRQAPILPSQQLVQSVPEDESFALKRFLAADTTELLGQQFSATDINQRPASIASGSTSRNDGSRESAKEELEEESKDRSVETKRKSRSKNRPDKRTRAKNKARMEKGMTQIQGPTPINQQPMSMSNPVNNGGAKFNPDAKILHRQSRRQGANAKQWGSGNKTYASNLAPMKGEVKVIDPDSFQR